MPAALDKAAPGVDFIIPEIASHLAEFLLELRILATAFSAAIAIKDRQD